MSTLETKEAVLARIAGTAKNVEIVPEHTQVMFDTIIGETEAEALRLYPEDLWARIQFWKEQVLDATASKFRGRISAMYHEYIARTLAADDLDPYGFEAVLRHPNPLAERIAQQHAYDACCASL